MSEEPVGEPTQREKSLAQEIIDLGDIVKAVLLLQVQTSSLLNEKLECLMNIINLESAAAEGGWDDASRQSRALLQAHWVALSSQQLPSLDDPTSSPASESGADAAPNGN